MQNRHIYEVLTLIACILREHIYLYILFIIILMYLFKVYMKFV